MSLEAAAQKFEEGDEVQPIQTAAAQAEADELQTGALAAAAGTQRATPLALVLRPEQGNIAPGA